MAFASQFRRQGRGDGVFKALAAASAFAIVLVTAGILFKLLENSRLALARFGPGFIFSSAWDPVKEQFGAASSIFGTLVSTAIAMLIAVPLSLAVALFLVEIAHPRLSRAVGGAIELLAAIPSIIFGMWGLFVFAPFMAKVVQPALAGAFGFLPFFKGAKMGIGILTAGIILSLMILPFICAVARDIFLMVPARLKESAYGLGATTWEVTSQVTAPYGLRGLVAAMFLGLGRAIGETMAVTFVIGNRHAISASLFAPGNSIASSLANEFTEASEPIYVSSLIALALVLFAITVVFNSAARLWLARLGGGGEARA